VSETEQIKFYVIWQRDEASETEGVSEAAPTAVLAIERVVEAWHLDPTWVTSVRKLGTSKYAKVKHSPKTGVEPVR
jgi:hypothetical protein